MSGRTLAYSEEFSELADPDGPGTILAIFFRFASPPPAAAASPQDKQDYESRGGGARRGTFSNLS